MKPIIHNPATLIRCSSEIALHNSKDPNTKVGAAVQGHGTDTVFFGYNGFPVGVVDDTSIWLNRDEQSIQLNKYDLVIHAEMNAAFKCLRAGFIPQLVFVTHEPCGNCVKHLAQLGVRAIFYAIALNRAYTEKTKLIAAHCGVELIHVKG